MNLARMSAMEQIKKIREATGAGILDVKKAFEEARGDEAKTLELLRKRGQDKAAKKSGRETVGKRSESGTGQ